VALGVAEPSTMEGTKGGSLDKRIRSRIALQKHMLLPVVVMKVCNSASSEEDGAAAAERLTPRPLELYTAMGRDGPLGLLLRGRIEVGADHRQIERMVRMQRLPSAVIVGDCRRSESQDSDLLHQLSRLRRPIF